MICTPTKRRTPQLSLAPEHWALGANPRELADVVGAFRAYQALESDHRLFEPPRPGEVVRLAGKALEHGQLAPAEAKQVIAGWKRHAAAQSPSRANAGRVVLSLFDTSGEWSQPWADAGYDVYRFDIQDNPELGDVNRFSVDFFSDWFGDFEGQDVYAVLAACPCTDFATSGARHFAAKDRDGRTVASVELVHQTLRVLEYFRPAVWAIENPVGRIEKLGGLPPWRLSFDPWHLGDSYTKKTLLWGRFNAALPVAPVDPVEGSKMHSKFGGNRLATKNARSVTPEGFAYAFFMANNALDHPDKALAWKYDRLRPELLASAAKAGLSMADVATLVDDAYYMDLDDAAAEQALREALGAAACVGEAGQLALLI